MPRTRIPWNNAMPRLTRRPWSSRAMLAQSAQRAPAPRRLLDLGAIATACALDYLTFRCPEIGWAEREPALLAWAQPHFLRPSMQDTTPVGS